MTAATGYPFLSTITWFRLIATSFVIKPTLRCKSVTVTVFVLGVYAGGVFFLVQRNASAALDERLRSDFRWATEMAEQRADGTLAWFDGDEWSEESPWLQVWSADGELVYQTAVARRLPVPQSTELARAANGQVVTVPTTTDPFRMLAGPATVELWDWREPKNLLQFGAEGHKALVNHLEFHPRGQWLIGAGGGSDSGLLAFWNLKGLTDVNAPQDGKKTAAEEKAARDEAADAQGEAEPRQEGKKEGKDEKQPDVPVHRVKFDGHAHRFVMNVENNTLYAAGYQKLELWSLGE